MGVSTEWLTMGSLEGKQIPDHLRQALLQFNADTQDIASDYQDEGRQRAHIDKAQRARALRLADGSRSRPVGTVPTDIARRLRELEARGMDRWMFYVGRSESDRMNQLRLICDGVHAASRP